MEIARLEEESLAKGKRRAQHVRSRSGDDCVQSQVFGCGIEISGGEIEQRVKSSIGGADGVGVCCVKGRRQHMEDAAVCKAFTLEQKRSGEFVFFFFLGVGGPTVDHRFLK